MDIFAAFAAGYLLGAQGGRARLAELAEAWRYLCTSEQVRAWVAEGLATATSLVLTQVRAAEEREDLLRTVGATAHEAVVRRVFEPAA